MMTQVSVRDARAGLADLLRRAKEHHERIVLTNHSEPVAVLMGIDDFESLMETLDVLGDAQTMADLARSQKEYEAGDYVTIERGMTLKELRRLES